MTHFNDANSDLNPILARAIWGEAYSPEPTEQPQVDARPADNNQPNPENENHFVIPAEAPSREPQGFPVTNTETRELVTAGAPRALRDEPLL